MNVLGFQISRSQTPADLVIEADRQRQMRPAQRDGHDAFEPLAVEERGSATGTIMSTDRNLAQAVFGGKPAYAGVRVTPENAMCIAAVFTCVRILSEDVASLPLKLYRRTDAGREIARDHPLYDVLQVRGNDVMTAMKLRELVVVHMMLWGNFFGEIQRNGRGDVVAIWPVHPGRVAVRLIQSGNRPQLRFDVYDANGGRRTLTQDQILFIPGLGTGIVGKSPIELHREGLGIAMQAEKYGAKFFANDARPGMVLKTPNALSDQAFERIKKDWERRHRSADNASKMAILEEGLEPAAIGLPPGDAQFLETRIHEAREVYGIYRVPPHKAGDLERATFSNIEHLGIQYVTGSLRPILVRIEQSVSAALLDEDERGEYYAEHLVDALLRGDLKSRYEAYAVARNWGWFSVNDIREMENLNPVEDGDIRLQPLNMVEAGTDPFAAANEDLDEDLEDDADERSRELRSDVETRALPSRYQEAKALETVLRDALAKVVGREVREVRAAVADFLGGDDGPDVDGFTDWLVSFADDHAGWTSRRMSPAYRAMAEAMLDAAGDELGEDVSGDELDGFVSDYVEAFGRRHAGSVRGQLLAIVGDEDLDAEEAIEERLGEWEEKRAKVQARRERQRSSNAFTSMAWAALGVATLTWRSVGKSCPICDEMDGRTTRVGQAFVGEGDQVADLDVTGSVSHPPIHDGCDCIMMPGTAARSRPTSAELRRISRAVLEAAGLERFLRRAAERPAKPRTRVQRRNAWIQAEYRARIAERYGERDVIIDELRSGTFEGEPYVIAPSTCRKVCDSGNA